MSQTQNIGLELTPEVSDEAFLAWRQKINGEANSNMTKIDEAIGELKANSLKDLGEIGGYPIDDITLLSGWDCIDGVYKFEYEDALGVMGTGTVISSDANGSVSQLLVLSPESGTDCIFYRHFSEADISAGDFWTPLKTKTVNSLTSTSAQDALSAAMGKQINDQKANEWIATASGDGSKYTVTLDPAPTELYAGMTITMIPNVTSKVNAVTLNVNGLGEKGLRLRSSTSTLGSEVLPSAGYLLAGDPVTLLYDGSYWIIEGTGVYSHATTSSKYGLGTSSNYGHVKLSDSTTNNSGAGMGVAATPAAVKAVADDLDTHTGNTTVHVTSTERNTWNGKANASHTHGNVTSDGKIGTTANKAVYTGTSGALQAGTLPVSAGGTGATRTIDAPFVPKAGGAMTGILTAYNLSPWTTGCVRNVRADTSAPTTTTCPPGTIYLQYE